MKTHVVAEQAFPMIVEDYEAGLPPTTYGALVRRCGFGPKDERWFGQVTDLIDAACALADVPSFALVRVLTSDHRINEEAWRKQFSHLRDLIIKTALEGSWTDGDFLEIKTALAVFSSRALGHTKAWQYAFERSTWKTGRAA
jgi:hypothetical protein